MTNLHAALDTQFFLLSRRQWLTQNIAAALAASPLFARAQAWPSRPLRLVVPFAPGGSSEIVARAVAGEMAKAIGQNVYVDNKPGAAGNIAMQEVPTRLMSTRWCWATSALWP